MSCAYVYALASKLGFKFQIPTDDDDSVDVQLDCSGLIDDSSVYSSPMLQIQMKATSNPRIIQNNGKSYYSFPLPIKNYNDLRGNTYVPRLLVLYILPTEENDWLSHSEENLVSRKCAYWCNLKDLPEVSNETTITVHIPKENVLNTEALKELMIIASKKEDMPHILNNGGENDG